MKTHYIAIILLFVFQNFSIGQEYQAKWSPVSNKKGNSETQIMIASMDSSFYYLLMYHSKGNTLFTYDYSHRQLSKKDLDFTNFKVKIDDVVKTSSGEYGLLNMIDKKKDEWVLFRSKFEEGSFLKPKEIFAHSVYRRSTKDKSSHFMPDRETNYQLSVSPDSSKVLFLNMISDDDRGEEQLAVAVFDDKMRLIWKKIQRFKYKDADLSIHETRVTNDGDVIILARATQWNKAFKGDDDLKLNYKVFYVTKKKVSETKLDLGNDFSSNKATLFSNPLDSSQFIVTGFYTDSDRKTGLKGLFFASGNPELGFNNIRLHKLSEDFLIDIVSEKRLKKSKGLEARFEIRTPLFYSDGSIGYIAEESDFRYEYDHYNVYRTVSNRIPEFSSDALIIPRFNLFGDLLSIQNVPKQFQTNLMEHTSFGYALDKDKLHLVFNAGDNTYSYDMGTYFEVIDINGKSLYSQLLFEGQDGDLLFKPRSFNSFGGKFLILAEKGKKYSIGLIDISD